MFSCIKNTVKPFAPVLSRLGVLRNAETRPKVISVAVMRDEMFPGLFTSRFRKLESEYEMVDFPRDDFDYIDWQDYKTGFSTVGEGFTFIPSTVSNHWVEVEA